MNGPEFDAGAVLAAAGMGPGAALTPLPGGRNNRVFEVDDGDRRALLKWYFAHRDDTRDRLGAEFGFVRFAWDQGIAAVAEPYACDAGERLALFEFVDGRRPVPGGIGAGPVAQAAAFFDALNRHRHVPAATDLPLASEACFSLEDHLGTVTRRVERLSAMPVGDDLDGEAAALATSGLMPALTDVRNRIEGADGWGDGDLPARDRCLSPSDFGFHNALVEADGTVRFVDFEYAGWDDPAKMVCDFFWQPQVPVPDELWPAFTEASLAGFDGAERLAARARLLHPLYGLKWCCIALNEFLPVGDDRRRFAGPSADADERRAVQLDLARGLYARTASVLADRVGD